MSPVTVTSAARRPRAKRRSLSPRRKMRFAPMLTAIVVLLSGCDTSPSGPATVAGVVSGVADLGAVVLDVVWTGVQGFEGQGSTQVYWADVPGEPDRHRVILVGPVGGPLTFGILVDDLYLEAPVVTVVEAVGSDDLPRPVSALTVQLVR